MKILFDLRGSFRYIENRRKEAAIGHGRRDSEFRGFLYPDAPQRATPSEGSLRHHFPRNERERCPVVSVMLCSAVF